MMCGVEAHHTPLALQFFFFETLVCDVEESILYNSLRFGVAV